MKRSIITLSLLTASYSNATNVEIYGIGHISTDSISNGTNSTIKVASNSSRLGFKAKHTINDSLSIRIQYESGVDITGAGLDDGNGGQTFSGNTFFTRTRVSFVALDGAFGTLKAGVLSVVDQWMYDYNLFGDQVGDLGNIWGRSSTFINRANDMIAYTTPQLMKGLETTFSYLSDQSVNYTYASVGDGKEISGGMVKLNYKKDALKLGFAYLNLNDDYQTNDSSDLVVTGSYTQDNYSIGGGYVRSENPDIIANRTKSNHDTFSLGGIYTQNRITYKVQFSAIADSVVNSSAHMIALGADYIMDKDTKVYISYAKTTNDATTIYAANNYGHGKAAFGAPIAGQDPMALSIGLVYKFKSSL